MSEPTLCGQIVNWWFLSILVRTVIAYILFNLYLINNSFLSCVLLLNDILVTVSEFEVVDCGLQKWFLALALLQKSLQPGWIGRCVLEGAPKLLLLFIINCKELVTIVVGGLLRAVIEVLLWISCFKLLRLTESFALEGTLLVEILEQAITICLLLSHLVIMVLWMLLLLVRLILEFLLQLKLLNLNTWYMLFIGSCHWNLT